MPVAICLLSLRDRLFCTCLSRFVTCFLLSPFRSFLGVGGRPHTMTRWYILCRRGRGPKQAKLPEKVKVFLKPDLPGEPLRDPGVLAGLQSVTVSPAQTLNEQ